jgi:hypothetical protein
VALFFLLLVIWANSGAPALPVKNQLRVLRARARLEPGRISPSSSAFRGRLSSDRDRPVRPEPSARISDRPAVLETHRRDF